VSGACILYLISGPWCSSPGAGSVFSGCGDTELGRTVVVGERKRVGWKLRVVGVCLIPYCGFCRQAARSRTRFW